MTIPKWYFLSPTFPVILRLGDGDRRMSHWDFFTGAPRHWRTEAKIRARRVIGEHADDPVGYVDKRLQLSHFASFQRRRWSYIRKLVAEMQAHEAKRAVATVNAS